MAAPDETQNEQHQDPENDSDDKKENNTPTGTDNTLSWLEELATGEPGAILDKSDLPETKVSAGVQEPQGDEMVPAWLQGQLEGDVPVDEAVPDWLKDELADATESDDLSSPVLSEPDDLEATLVVDSGIQLPDEAIPQWLRDTQDDEIGETPAERLEQDLNWLDKIAAREGEPIEEPPTMSRGEIEDDNDALTEELSEEMTWMADLDTLHDLPDGELEDDEGLPVSTDESAAASLGIKAVQDVADIELLGDDLLSEVPEDPDEAMAWLEDLALRQGAPTSELTSTYNSADDVVSIDEEMLEISESSSMDDAPVQEPEPILSETVPEQASSIEVDRTPLEEEEPIDLFDPLIGDQIVSETMLETAPELPLSLGDDEAPEDLDEALAWLDRLALEPEAHLDELFTEEPVGTQPETPSDVDNELENALSELDDINLPVDMDEAMNWLVELAGPSDSIVEESVPAGPDEIVVETPQLTTEEQIKPDLPLETPLLDFEIEPESDQPAEQVEEEIDEAEEAISWLEQLAARQGASTDELLTPTDDILEDIEAPEWIAREAAELVADLVEPDVEDKLSDLIEDIDEAILLQDLEEAIEEPEKDFEIRLESVGEALSQESPEKLPTEIDVTAADSDIAWMESSGELDADKWLGSQEFAATEPEPDIADEIESQMVSQIDEPLPVDFELVGDSMPDTQSDIPAKVVDAQRLGLARSAMQAGDLHKALDEYANLVRDGKDLLFLIMDLESSVQAHSDKPLIRRVLGDAYVRNGQLRKALEVYREALDLL